MAEKLVSGSRIIEADAAEIFAVIQDPRRHGDFDGSGTVKDAQLSAPDKLELGSKFGMKMRNGLPYVMTSNVVEFEQDRCIAWAHFGGHRWRYELEPVDGGTRVIESFDWSTSKAPWFIEMVGYPDRHRVNIAATLERLEQLF